MERKREFTYKELPDKNSANDVNKKLEKLKLWKSLSILSMQEHNLYVL